MFRRRRRGSEDADANVPEGRATEAGAPDDADADEPTAAAKPPRPDGPWDVSEVAADPAQPEGADADGADVTSADDTGADDAAVDPAAAAVAAGVVPVGTRVDLGAIRVPGVAGMQLQVQLDEASQQVTGVLVVLGDAAVQLLAVAAPRTEALWPDLREQVAADAARRGGSATEAEGPFGTELRVVVPVSLPDGTKGVQPSRMVGIDGPRWLLRANFLGRAAVDQAAYDRLAEIVRGIVVVRGDKPMPPGDLIPFRLPPGAQPARPAQRAQEQPAPRPERPRTVDDLGPGPTSTEVR